MIRKYIAYVVLVLFLIAAGCAGTFYIITQQQKAQLAIRDTKIEQGEAKLLDLATAYQNQSKAVDTIRKSMEITDALIENLSVSVNDVRANSAEVRNRVASLEKNNATFRLYLNEHLPVDGCMLDDTCAKGGNSAGKNGNGAAKPGVADPVPATATGAKSVK